MLITAHFFCFRDLSMLLLYVVHPDARFSNKITIKLEKKFQFVMKIFWIVSSN